MFGFFFGHMFAGLSLFIFCHISKLSFNSVQKMREERRRREVERRRVKEDDRRPRKDPSDREGSGRDMRDRGQGRDKQWETDRQRDKVLEKGHDYKAGRDKDVGEKTEGFHHHHPVKVRVNNLLSLFL